MTNSRSSETAFFQGSPVKSEVIFARLLKDAQQKSKKLLPNIPQDEVRALLGEPDETAARTFGSATAHPWNGVVWMYRWHQYNG